jgi:hypothetical protein
MDPWVPPGITQPFLQVRDEFLQGASRVGSPLPSRVGVGQFPLLQRVAPSGWLPPFEVHGRHYSLGPKVNWYAT